MTDQIGVLGVGLLRDTIADALGGRAITVSPEDSNGRVALLVTASDTWDTSYHTTARALAADERTPWLPVWTELGHAVVGPLEVPGEAGCVACASLRRHRIQVDRAERAAVRQRRGEVLTHRPSSWLTGLAAQQVAALVTDEVGRVARGDHPRTRLALHRVQLAELTVTRHRFLPDPLCPVCGNAPDDDAELARITLQPRPAHEPGSYRTRTLSDQLPRLTETYVDDESGLIRSLDGWSMGALVSTAAPLGWRNPRTSGGGYGAAGTFRESRLTALLEALERYGSSPGGRRTAVTAIYNEVREHALDPRALGLYPPERYRLSGFRFQPFAPDRPYPWVWGWSFARREPILVPEHYAYYSAPHHDGIGGPFVYEVSNGCALGSCIEEAILYGILEVAERDAFLLTWYARLAAPRIDLTTAKDRSAPLLAASIHAETGYQVLAFDISTEQRIPCVWTMAVNPASGDGRPAVACSAGAHPDPEQAARGALCELGPSLARLIRKYEDPATARRASQMAADSTRVREMDDHMLLYADPGAATRLGFLTRSEAARALADVGGREKGGFASDDLRDNLLEAVGRYTDHGLDVIVVDQTASEHRAGGFSCVKVLIPGTLSMTFGHHHRRVDGLPRLYRVPHLLGYRDRPLRPEEVNPYPHPFP